MATTQEEILFRIARIVSAIAGTPVKDVQSDKSFVDDLNIDAMIMVEVFLAMEQHFGVGIPDEDMKNLKTVGDAAAYVLKHLE